VRIVSALLTPPAPLSSGAWRGGRKNGRGEQRDGVTHEVYRGKFVGGERCGRGVCERADGSRSEGVWRKEGGVCLV
jgi:MORN repeat